MPSDKHPTEGHNKANSNFKVIKPAQFETSAGSGDHLAEQGKQGRSGGPSKVPLILAVLGLLACLLFVIVWLPKLVNTQAPSVSTSTAPSNNTNKPTKTATSAPPSPTSTASTEESPYTAAQLAKQRKDAQAALEKLLEKQQELETLSVQDWADDEFRQAIELATSGDANYRQRQFLAATESYNNANEILSKILENKSGFIDKVIAAGEQALKNGKKDPAIEAFRLVQKIEPDNLNASNGIKRAETIEQVFPLFAQAANQSQENQFEEAISTYKEILKIDPLATDASTAIAALTSKRNDEQFSRYMSRGLAAIDSGKADTARDYFNKAAKLKPNDKGLKDGLRQVSRMQSNARINRYLSTVARFEDQEEWAQVIKTLDTAIAKEGELSRFTDRRDVAANRLLLDQRLQKMIEKPELLSDDNTYKAAEKILDQARSVSPNGPKLNGQIGQAEELLKAARIPLDIVIESDNLTDINVFKVARLGKISSKTLTLKPGKYVITGARNGYRDVRQEIILKAGDSGKSFRIVCTQPI